MTHRIARLENMLADDVPLAVRRWLGDPLTDADKARAANAEEFPPVASMPRLDAAMRIWLAERDATTNGEGC